MVEITFGSWDELMEQELRARQEADKRVKPWHYKLRAGDIAISLPYRDLPVFHELLDNELLVKENFERFGDDYESEAQYVLDTYCFSPEPWNYRFARNYSSVVPEGELGDFHLSVVIGKISKEDFERIKKNGFYIDEPPEITR